ncbi:hypothetical protein BsWGS_12419 [Bradybaena similaris]
MDEDLKAQKTNGEIHDPGGNHVETTNGVKVHMMLQRSARGATTQHTVYLPINEPVQQLKQAVEHMFMVTPECQTWWFKNRELNNSDTIAGSKIRAEDYIQVKIEKQGRILI